MAIPEDYKWKLDDIEFSSYGVYVSKSSGVLDLPRLVDTSIDWLDENGKEYWQDIANSKFDDREINLSCWIKATGYSSFKTKVATFFAALTAAGVRVLSTPFANSINVSLHDSVQVTRKASYIKTKQIGVFNLRLIVAGDSKTGLMGIYRTDGVLRQVVKYGSDAKLSRSLQGDASITFTSEFNSIQTIGRGDYILWGSEKYISLEYPQIEKVSSNKYVYRLIFTHQFFVLKDIQFRVIDRSDTAWWANMEDIIDMIVTNSNRAYSGLFIKGTIDTTENRNHQFSNESCYEVLNRCASDYGLEWEFVWISATSKIQINVKKTIAETTAVYLTYGKGNELYKMSRVSTGREQMVTHLYAYGADKNIPASYGYPRLKLAVEPVTRDYFGMHIERTKIFDDIFPERTGTVTGYVATEKQPTWEYMPGTFIKIYTFYPDDNTFEVTDSSMDFDLKETDVDGNTLYLIAGTTAKLHFNSGDLAGYEFEVSDYNHATKTFKILPYKDEHGTILPNATLKPAIGDTYKILDITLPGSYIVDAESRLQTAADDFIDETGNPKAVYTVETTPYFAIPDYMVGKNVNIVDVDFDIDTEFRVTDITTNIYKGDSSLTLSQYVEKSKRQELSLKSANLERSIVAAKLDQVTKVRASQKTSGELKNAILSPVDQKINTDNKVRSKSLDPRMFSHDASILQYSIKDALLELNVDDNANKITVNSGTFIHHSFFAADKATIKEVKADGDYDPTRSWVISATDITFANNNGHFIYLKIPLESGVTTSSIIVSESHIDPLRDDDFVIIKLGYINPVETVGGVDIREASMLFGNSKANTSSSVSDAAYDTDDWDGVTDIAPSKNALRDKFETFGSISTKHFWSGTLTAYNAISTKDSNTIYFIEE